MTKAVTFTQSHFPADTSQDLLEITLGELMRKNAREVPDRLALVEGISGAANRRRWTYRELVDEAETLAHALLRQFRPGERIGMLAPDTPEWLIFQHAVNFAGLILVPINPAYTAREVEFVLKNSESSGLIYADSSRGKDLKAIFDAVRPNLPLLRETVRVADYEALLKSADPSVELPNPALTDIVQIQYTSGTTGFPKGACLHHRGVINTSRNIALRAGFPDGGVWLNAMPMFHIAGDIVAEIGAYVMRGTFVLMQEFNPGLMLELFEEERVETTLIVPTMILALLEHPDCARRDCSSLLTILSGAANVPAALVNRAQEAFGCGFSIMYGLTESNGPFLETSPADTVKDQTETVGKPAPHSEVKIVDPVTLETQPVNTVGEIWVRGFMPMKGYYGQPEATAAVLMPDGWLRTGDLGTMDERGYFKITGRLKEMIIRGGMNLYPQEIENVLFDHPAVGQIAVVGVPSEQWGEVVAAVVLATNQSALPSVDELYAHCRANLSPQKTPEKWFFVNEYPLTATGKIQKNVILEWIAAEKITAENWSKPEKTERTA
ncbi:MAG: AMP-binding protein [Rhodobiaceae bacterium]|nr:AMP-binding protein [Rhodobiaceae bacterium]